MFYERSLCDQRFYEDFCFFLSAREMRTKATATTRAHTHIRILELDGTSHRLRCWFLTIFTFYFLDTLSTNKCDHEPPFRVDVSALGRTSFSTIPSLFWDLGKSGMKKREARE